MFLLEQGEWFGASITAPSWTVRHKNSFQLIGDKNHFKNQYDLIYR